MYLSRVSEEYRHVLYPVIPWLGRVIVKRVCPGILFGNVSGIAIIERVMGYGI